MHLSAVSMLPANAQVLRANNALRMTEPFRVPVIESESGSDGPVPLAPRSLTHKHWLRLQSHAPNLLYTLLDLVF